MGSDFFKAILIWYLLNSIIDSLNDEDRKDFLNDLDKIRNEKE